MSSKYRSLVCIECIGCMYYMYLKTVISTDILFSPQKACEHQSILPAYGIRSVTVLHMGAPVYSLSGFCTYSVLTEL